MFLTDVIVSWRTACKIPVEVFVYSRHLLSETIALAPHTWAGTGRALNKKCGIFNWHFLHGSPFSHIILLLVASHLHPNYISDCRLISPTHRYTDNRSDSSLISFMFDFCCLARACFTDYFIWLAWLTDPDRHVLLQGRLLSGPHRGSKLSGSFHIWDIYFLRRTCFSRWVF